MSDTEQDVVEQPPQEEEVQEEAAEDEAADKGSAEQQDDAETDEQQQETQPEPEVTQPDPEPEPEPEPEATQPEPEETQPDPEPEATEPEPEPEITPAVEPQSESQPEPEQTSSEEDKKPEPEEVSKSDLAEPPKDSATNEEVVVEETPAVSAPVEAGDKDEEVKEKPKPSVAPRTKLRSTNPREGVDLAFGEEEITKRPPITVGQMFRDTVSRCPAHVALRFKEDGEWKEYTYTQYYHLCIQAAKSFLKLGLEEFNAVGILGFNSAEWLISNIGAMFAGGLSCGIYATNGPEACQYVAEHSKANILVVENQKQLDKILQVRDNLPHLKAIVQYKGKLSESYPNVYDWEQFMELGKDMEDTVIEEKIDGQKPEQCALLVYTSGTTGNPKGVMLSHDNLTWTTMALHTTITVQGIGFQEDHIISYLPLSHIAAQVIDIYLTIYMRATVHFAQPDALKGTLLQTLLEVQPTMFFGVPRVWEKFKDAMQAAGANITGIKKRLSTWAKGIGLEGNTNIQKGQSVPWGWTLANMLVFKKVRERLGLTRLKMAVTGAAPIHRDVLEYFMSINIPIMEVFGMSENSGPQTLSVINKWRVGTCGPNIAGVQMKIHEPDDSGEGELCMYGRHVFMGYMDNEEKTKEAIDDEGWLHSGDIARIDKDGFMSITGRIKEIIITSGGENMAPVPIEDRIKKAAPFLSNVMLIGDKRKYVTCLITIQCVMNPDTGEPEDDISPVALKMIAALGSSCTKVSEIVQQKDEKIFKAIQDGLNKANEHAVSNAQRVQKFTILEKDFSVPGQELGPTLKLKRYVVAKKYAEQIEAMYEEVAKV